ncbi:hypothetical protein ACHAPB_007135 [Verticillium nonalfalfae]
MELAVCYIHQEGLVFIEDVVSQMSSTVPLSADEVTLTLALLTPHLCTPVVGMTPASDSTQIWLGTNNDETSAQKGADGDRESDCIKQDLFEKNQATHELCQSVVK